MPQVEQVQRRSKKPAILVGVGAVVVVAAVVGGVLWLKQPRPVKLTKDAALHDARDQAFNGNKDAAIALLQKQIGQTSNAKDKSELYMQIGATYEGKGDFKDALVAYQAAGKIESSFGTNDSIARAAEKAGDKGLALEYYQKNLQLFKDGKALYHGPSERKTLEDTIVRLGGSL
jgi:tetratricopeptide (TPR) repeat protein